MVTVEVKGGGSLGVLLSRNIKYLPGGGCLLNKPGRNLFQKMKLPIDLYVSRKVWMRRMELGLSQVKLAGALGISVGFVGMAESPGYKTHYNLKHLNTLAKILKCSPKDFLPPQPLKK